MEQTQRKKEKKMNIIGRSLWWKNERKMNMNEKKVLLVKERRKQQERVWEICQNRAYQKKEWQERWNINMKGGSFLEDLPQKKSKKEGKKKERKQQENCSDLTNSETGISQWEKKVDYNFWCISFFFFFVMIL